METKKFNIWRAVYQVCVMLPNNSFLVRYDLWVLFGRKTFPEAFYLGSWVFEIWVIIGKYRRVYKIGNLWRKVCVCQVPFKYFFLLPDFFSYNGVIRPTKCKIEK